MFSNSGPSPSRNSRMRENGVPGMAGLPKAGVRTTENSVAVTVVPAAAHEALGVAARRYAAQLNHFSARTIRAIGHKSITRAHACRQTLPRPRDIEQRRRIRNSENRAQHDRRDCLGSYPVRELKDSGRL
jgi:hypothetical protein